LFPIIIRSDDAREFLHLTLAMKAPASQIHMSQIHIERGFRLRQIYASDGAAFVILE